MSLPITLESSSVKSVLDDQIQEEDEYNPKSQIRPYSNGSEKKKEKAHKDPREVHEARTDLGQSTKNIHAKGGDKGSVLPKKLQGMLPEKVERVASKSSV
ncbi:unnamed protein product [Clonostachys chloroleuca]|uniref:Uncharacterized protein n=1 Tax=Clonostachys chloroleuca TaxID=1926264 RepID=A0AA35M9F6_9HYPO|nr:unnamed protein product [Clonostachys chloroleuca]